jgi:hypothetical protein
LTKSSTILNHVSHILPPYLNKRRRRIREKKKWMLYRKEIHCFKKWWVEKRKEKVGQGIYSCKRKERIQKIGGAHRVDQSNPSSLWLYLMTGQLKQRLGFDDNVIIEGERDGFMCVCVRKRG